MSNFPDNLLYPRNTANPLHAAVINRDAAKVKQLLDQKTDPTEFDSHGCAPIYYTIHVDSPVDVEIAEILLEYGADVEVAVKGFKQSYTSPLMLAVQVKSVELVQLFLSFGALPNFSILALIMISPKLFVCSKQNIDAFGNIIKLMLMHMIKLGMGEQFKFNPMYNEIVDDIEKYYEECHKEVERMRKQMLYREMSLYDVLKWQKYDPLKVHKIEFDKVNVAFKRCCVKYRYPIYHDFLHDRMSRICKYENELKQAQLDAAQDCSRFATE